MLHQPGHPYTLEQEEPPKLHTMADACASVGLIARLIAWWRLGRWKIPLALFLMTFIVYGVAAFDRIKAPSADNHFVYLANTYNDMILASLGNDAARERRAQRLPFELDRDPPHYNDWASYWELTLTDGEVVRGVWMDRTHSGRFMRLDKKEMFIAANVIDRPKTRQRYYVSFPPGPAVLMMPLALIQKYKLNDVIWTLLCASLNVALFYILLERLSIGGRSGRSRNENFWLVALFGLSTAHFWCSVLGQVWFTALIMGVTCTLLYVLCSLDARHPFLAGVFCALAFSTRTPLLFTSIFFFLFVLFPGGKVLQKEHLGAAVKKLALFCTPCLVAGISLMVMNKIRFDSYSEFGHTYLAAGQLQRIQEHGLFAYHFLSINLTAMWTLLPTLTTTYPYVQVSTHGMSLLVTTPALVLLLWPAKRESSADHFWHRALWATVAVCAVPGLFYQNTGYEQFGFRFSLDYTIYVMMLIATGRHPITRGVKAAILFGAAVNAFGAITFKRFSQFYVNRLLP